MTYLRKILKELGYTEAAIHLEDLPKEHLKAAIAAWKAYAEKIGRSV